MIKSFRCKETEKIFYREFSKKFPTIIQRTALKKLWMIDAAGNLKDLTIPPSNRLEKLKGKRAGQYSVRINDQWRVCFSFRQGDAHEVEIVDYH